MQIITIELGIELEILSFRYISAFPDSKYFGPIFNKLVTIGHLVAHSHPSSIP